MPDVSVLDIYLQDRTIGTLTRLQGDRSLLAFTDDYINDAQRPTLSLSFKDNLGGLITLFNPRQTRVEPFFANTLPEGVLREYLAKRAGVGEGREFFLLWALGRDLPGALTLTPADGDEWPIDDARAGDKKQRRSNALRFSLAGVQLKFSAINRAKQGYGLVIPAKGVGGSWIVKLPAGRFEGIPENEFAMMSLARQIGIEVPEIALLDTAAIEGLPDEMGKLRGKSFAIRRFDRSDDGPIHIEDFAQVFGAYPEEKYKRATYRRIAGVLSIETGEHSVAEFIRRLVFSTLIGNADMHLKNWSLIYPDGRTPRLSPAYDLVSTIPYIPDETAALKYARTKKMAELDKDELSYLAAKARLPEKLVLDTASETVERFLDLWGKEKNNLDVAKDVTASIDAHLKTLTLIEQSGRRK